MNGIIIYRYFWHHGVYTDCTLWPVLINTLIVTVCSNKTYFSYPEQNVGPICTLSGDHGYHTAQAP